jgi:DNA-directed RNA polymerase subunit F
VIIHKLIAWRPRDRDDIRSILEADVAPDREYLDRWISAWDLADRWASFS